METKEEIKQPKPYASAVLVILILFASLFIAFLQIPNSLGSNPLKANNPTQNNSQNQRFSSPYKWLTSPPYDSYVWKSGDAEIIQNATWQDNSWLWQIFTRGNYLLLQELAAEFETSDVARAALGERDADELARAFAQVKKLALEININSLTPEPDLASSLYAIADANYNNYVVLERTQGDAIVDLTAHSDTDTFQYKWLDIDTHTWVEQKQAEETVTGGYVRNIEKPMRGAGVLHLSLKNIGVENTE